MLIDLPQVRARVAQIVVQFADPLKCRASIHALLVDYSDHSLRASQKLTDNSVGNRLKTPAPVVRQIVMGLRQSARAAPQTALELSKGLWAAGSREERRLAAEVLGFIAPTRPAEALALIEGWLPEIESADTATALAEQGLAPLALADPGALMQNALKWATHPLKWIRRFALVAILPLTKDKTWDDVPGALSVVRVTMDDPEPEIRQAVRDVLAALLPHSPAEVNLFLREQAARSSTNAHLIARSLLTKLTPQDQADLIKVMRT